MAKLERQIAACTIRAPSPGIAIYGTSADWYQRREDPIEVGDMVRKGQKIFTIPNSDLMGVELRVHEASVNMVDPGQRVVVTVEALPDLVFYGQVLSVAPLPDPQHGWLDPGVKVYTTARLPIARPWIPHSVVIASPIKTHYSRFLLRFGVSPPV